MVTVTNQPIQAPTDLGSSMGYAIAPLKWLLDHFFLIAMLVIFGVTITLIFVFYYMNNEEKKEQEDMLYREYKNSIRTIKKNKDPKMYTTKYSMFNIMLLGLPIFHYKVGRKIYDQKDRFVGFYDGMFTDMLGNVNLLLWKDKTFGIVKNDFVLRIPTKAYVMRDETHLIKDNKTKAKNSIGDETYYIQTIELDKNLIMFSEIDKTIKIKMINYIKNDYYYYPVFEDDKGQTLDLTESINVMNQISSSNNLLTQVIKESGKNVIGMAKTNTELVYEQRKPEKVKEIEND